MPRQDNTFMVEDARIIFRNFAGKETPFNAAGKRNFAVLLDPEMAEQLSADGWNVKVLEPREEGDEPQPYIQVAVSYDQRPPRVVMITSAGRVNLNADNIETLDWADIRKVDLVCNPYNWTVGAKSGIKAYLKTMFVTIDEDELERKYAQHDVEPD